MPKRTVLPAARLLAAAASLAFLAFLASLVPMMPGAGNARAAAFERPLSQLDYPTPEASRPLTLARGWVEFSIRGGYQVSDSYFDSDGKEKDGTFDYRLGQVDLSVRYGWSRSLTLQLTMPFLAKGFSSDEGADISAWGLGDGSFSIRAQVWGEAKPLTSIAAEIALEFPSGSDSPGAINNLSLDDLIFGRGIYSLHFVAMAKHAFTERLAATAKLGYVLRIPGTVEYVAGIHGEAGRIDYGNEFFGSLETTLQLPDSIAPWAGMILFAPVAVPVWASGHGLPEGFALSQKAAISYHGGTDAGVRGHLEPVPNTEGYSLRIGPTARLQVNANWDVVAEVEMPIAGKNSLSIFPIEATGNFYRLNVLFRY